MGRSLLPVLALLLAIWAPARAQTAPATQADDVHVYLVTVGPGAEVWEKFGHNMIWIHDPQARIGDPDAALSWGMFDFDNFIVNFLRKRMRYWMGAYKYKPMIQDYVDADRSVWVQELNLTEEQKEALLDRVEVNLEPQNIHYDYDYYLDNCSTRVRDAIDATLGGEIRGTLEGKVTEHSYRWHTRRLMADEWLADLALQFVLGPWTDRPIDQWQESFLPVQFMRHIRQVQTAHGPLVLSEQTLHMTSGFPEREAPPNRLLPYLVIGVMVGAASVGIGLARNRWARRGCTAIAFLWCLVGAFGGIALVILWFFSPHIPPAQNQNLLQLNPLFVIPLALIPFLRRPRVRMIVFYTVMAAVALSFLGVLLKLVPMNRQTNFDILAMTFTANLGLVVGVYLRNRSASKER